MTARVFELSWPNRVILPVARSCSQRGTSALNWILTALVFNVIPTVFEVALVNGILMYGGLSHSEQLGVVVVTVVAVVVAVAEMGCEYLKREGNECAILLLLPILMRRYSFGWEFALVSNATLISYVAFTGAVTEWRTAFLRDRNRLENQSSSMATESLMNYETVK